MSERYFRIFLGSSLILFLYMQWHTMMPALISMLLFEGITNLRIPIVLTWLRNRFQTTNRSRALDHPRLYFEAERVLRLIISFLLYIGETVYPQELWFLSWFVAYMLLGAGLTNICPMNLALKRVGFG